MPIQISGVVTRRSNGALEVMASDGRAVQRVVLHESALGSKALPAMGDEVTLDIVTTRTAAEIEAAQVARLDGQPLVRGADGLVHGEPLNLTDAERAAMSKLEPSALGAPNVRGAAGVTERRRKP
jgi:hypothetical protein